MWKVGLTFAAWVTAAAALLPGSRTVMIWTNIDVNVTA
jgi:hypothetical protein